MSARSMADAATATPATAKISAATLQAMWILSQSGPGASTNRDLAATSADGMSAAKATSSKPPWARIARDDTPSIFLIENAQVSRSSVSAPTSSPWKPSDPEP